VVLRQCQKDVQFNQDTNIFIDSCQL